MKIIFNTIFIVTIFISNLNAQIHFNDFSKTGLMDYINNYNNLNYNSYLVAENPASFWENNKYDAYNLKFSYNQNNGEFHRIYDPKKRNQFHAQIEQVKVINSTTVILGYINYATEKLNNVSQAIEYEPYNDVFLIADTTTGNFDFSGPELGCIYNKNIYSWLSLGININYKLYDGLKLEDTKAKISRHIINGTLGVNIYPNSKWKIGISYSPYLLQNKININDNYLISKPIIKKYFGDTLSISNEADALFNRMTRRKSSQFAGDFKYKFSPFIYVRTAGQYLEEREKEYEIKLGGLSYYEDYGKWQRKAWRFTTDFFYSKQDWPVSLGLSHDKIRSTVWCWLPKSRLILKEKIIEWTNYGFHFRYTNNKSSFVVKTEYILTDFLESGNNVIVFDSWQRNKKTGILNCEMQAPLTSKLTLMLGSKYGKQMTEYHLSTGPVTIRQIRVGTKIIFEKINFDVLVSYESWYPEVEKKYRNYFSFNFFISKK